MFVLYSAHDTHIHQQLQRPDPQICPRTFLYPRHMTAQNGTCNRQMNARMSVELKPSEHRFVVHPYCAMHTGPGSQIGRKSCLFCPSGPHPRIADIDFPGCQKLTVPQTVQLFVNLHLPQCLLCKVLRVDTLVTLLLASNNPSVLAGPHADEPI